MKEYSCVIVDDESKSIEQLEEIVLDLYTSIDIVGKYTSWKEAFERLQANDVDILLLDIQMPQKTGVALLKLLPALKSEVIFVTADPSYALDAFDMQASGYILKPVEDAVVKKHLDKAIERLQYKRLAEGRGENKTAIKNKIGIPNSEGQEYIDVDSIIYIESSTRYSKIKMLNREIVSSYSIGKFKAVLDQAYFIQVHRSYIVNVNHIAAYKNNGIVVMTDKKEIPVVKTERDNLQNLFQKISK